jgi:hypothetical protein
VLLRPFSRQALVRYLPLLLPTSHRVPYRNPRHLPRLSRAKNQASVRDVEWHYPAVSRAKRLPLHRRLPPVEEESLLE